LKGLGVMSHVRKLLPRNILVMLYHTLIYPYLAYCNIVWGAAKPTLLHRLLVLQKRAVRLCTGAGYRASSTPLFKLLRVLNITDINKLQTALFMFKHKHNLIPLSCISYLSHSSEIRIHNTRNKADFVLDRFKSTVRELSISIRGPRLWNSLPDYLLDTRCVGLFKKHLMSHYMQLL